MESKESFLKNALQLYNFTEAQLYCAKEIISILSENFDVYNPIKNNEIKKNIKKNYTFEGITNEDILYSLQQLADNFYFIQERFDGTYKITLAGQIILQTNKDFIEYLEKEIDNKLKEIIEENRLQKEQSEINTLTIKNLKGSIFKMKYAWLFILLNAVLTFIISIIVAYVIKSIGLD